MNRLNRLLFGAAESGEIVFNAIFYSLIIATACVALQLVAKAAPVVKIVQRHPDAMCSWSGTIVCRLPDKRLGILTCAHEYAKELPVRVEIEDGQWAEGQILELNSQADLGFVAVKYDGEVKCYLVADAPPAIGDSLIVEGFPKGEYFRSRKTKLENAGRLYCRLHSTFIPGESGGAVVTPNARLVGVIVRNTMPNDLTWLPCSRGEAINWTVCSQFVQGVTSASQKFSGKPSATKPILYVFGYNTCGQCLLMRKDRKAGKLAVVDETYEIKLIDVRSEDGRQLAGQYGVTDVPAFAPADHSWETIVGYKDAASFLAEITPHLAQPYRRSPALQQQQEPQAPGPPELGEVVPVQPASPRPAQPPAMPVTTPTPPAATEPQIDWSAVQIVLTFPEGSLGPKISGLAGAAKLVVKNPRAVLPIGDAESLVNDVTGGKAAVKVITERWSPAKFEAFVAATGIPREHVSITAIVKAQPAGLKGVVAGLLERLAKSKLNGVVVNVVSIAPIFERVDGDRFTSAITALAIEESPPAESAVAKNASTDDDPFWMKILAGLGVGHGVLSILRQRRAAAMPPPVAAGGAA